MKAGDELEPLSPSPTYQPSSPSGPDTCGVMTGAVRSGGAPA
jgi:hypothetical protein